ncbi:peptidase M18 [Lasiosphaeria miniovina]|uniref:Peptidase M18 n=1 Tax=Lasiosphaeria miniovina TaxID=1954250 RepID=A0AA40B619_9PEZI|nr:peptidase M18 [Lasiosphaeria miniovina]KAK0728365.1 peptidase M18 [Lasiosphaeria miniovina]
MTRHSPQFLAARGSNMSLRSLALEQSMASRLPSSADSIFKRIVDANDIKPEDFTKPYCDFMTGYPTVFHATEYFKETLTKAGYTELPSRDDWAGKLEPGGKYFVTRNGSSIIAFAIGKAYKPGNGVAMVAGHIDALTARLKPVSTKPVANGYVQLGVAPYASALNETWWDRDLSIGGRVIVRDPDTGKTTVKLAKLDWPIARIPTLAPHFGLAMTGHNNKETEAVPIIGLDNSDLFPASGDAATTTAAPLGGAGSFASTQPPKLVKLIAGELGIADYSTILNWELELYDSQPATVGGLDKEFIFAGRIDDKLCSWAAFMALLHAKADDGEGVIKLVALFDDEEIGSLLRQGARGNFLPITIERAVEALSASSSGTPFGPGIIGQTYARSFLVSSDVTHAAHPNFTQTNLAGHSPRLNVGVALCVDGSAHMTTDSVSMAILDRVASLSGCVNQRHMIRNDSRSGGTVGPMLSSAMGVKAADVGIPQLSMHSVRATTGSLDPGLGLKFYKGFLDNWEKVDKEWHA